MARILIAEDEDSVRAFVSRALETAGHDIDAVADGGAALARLAGADYDLLLADIVMPVMDGVALALNVTRDHPGLPIVLMTGFSAEAQRAHNLESLIFEVVGKPFSLDEICAVVGRALGAATKDQ